MMFVSSIHIKSNRLTNGAYLLLILVMLLTITNLLAVKAGSNIHSNLLACIVGPSAWAANLPYQLTSLISLPCCAYYMLSCFVEVNLWCHDTQ
jgi:hypothetical protein